MHGRSKKVMPNDVLKAQWRTKNRERKHLEIKSMEVQVWMNERIGGRKKTEEEIGKLEIAKDGLSKEG